MAKEKVKPQVIVELEKALGVKVNGFDQNINEEITMLDISGTKLSSLKGLSSIPTLSKLSRLFLRKNQLIDISFLSELTSLHILDLSHNQLTDISSLSKLLNLELLYLKGNNLVSVADLKDLKNLQILDISENFLNDIEGLSDLVSITNLNISKNNLIDISPLGSLVKLEELNLEENKLSDISPLKKNENLIYLLLASNNLSNVSLLSHLTHLKDLDLSNNQIQDISSLSNLENLEIIKLGYNQLSNIFPLASLKYLRYIELNHNRIKDISGFSALISLEDIDLANNQLLSFIALSNLNKLKCINLSHNKIKSIIKKDINRFSVEKVTVDQSDYSGLNLHGNPLPIEMIEAINSGGKQALLEYLDAQEKGTIKIGEAKMVLLGEPRAGKTTLQKYLMGLPIDENEASTPDIQISSWRPFQNDKSLKEISNVKINLWDFGGQEIQYSLHKLFMTTDTLYIIVLDSTKDQSPEKYIAFLENYAPRAPFIIVNNYADIQTSTTLKIDENKLREIYNGRDERLPVLKAIFNRVSVVKAAQESSVFWENKLFNRFSYRKSIKNDTYWRKTMDELVHTIKIELLNLENLNKNFPIEYQKVKQAIEKEYIKPNKHYITMSYFRELCKSLEVTNTESRRTAILLYLNQIGVLRYFSDSPLRDKHILNPKWLIDGAYSIIINELTIINQGVLSKKQACQILECSNKFDFYEEEAEFIFKTMNFYGLLHFEESEQKLYIPIRFGSNQPIALSKFYEVGKHFYFEFKADIPEDIMPYLIVKHFSEIKNKHYWSKGAVFTKDDISVLAKVEDRTIHFYIIGNYHQSYFDTIRSTLKKTLEKLPGLEYEEMVKFEYEGKNIKAKYDDLLVVVNEDWGDYRDYASRARIDSSEIIKILGGYFSQAEIRQVTNHYYAPVTINDNRYQQTHIFNELERLVKSSQEPNDQKELRELIEELKAFKNEKKVETKETLGKSILGKIKKMSSEVAEEGIKDKLKELFPTVLQMGIEAVKRIDLQQIESLLS